MLEEVQFARTQGHAYDCKEFSPGLYCVAAPVYDHTNALVAAISIGVPTQRLADGRLPEMAQLVQEYAKQRSHTLGWLEP